MRLPVIQGVIDRRILVNYRVDPDVLARILPAPFRPQIVRGSGVAGICLIRLQNVRPAHLPGWLGISSENAAHRVAVEWDKEGQTHHGVYILRRDTNSRLNSLAGGRLFPGLHHHARFQVHETTDHFEVAMQSDDRTASVSVVADLTATWPASRVFRSLAEASDFFEQGSLGYSPSHSPGTFQGLELECQNWQAQPLDVRSAQSSVFDDKDQFPSGTIELDGALLMRGIAHEWHSRTDICCKVAASQPRLSPALAAH